MNENIKKEVLSLSGVVRKLCALLMIVFFMSTHVVSCSGYEVPIRPYDAATGVTYMDESMSDPNGLVWLLLLLPLVLLLIHCAKFAKVTITKKMSHICTAAIGAATFIGYIALNSGITSYLKDTGDVMTFEVRATIWFWIAILATVVIAGAGVLALMGKVDMDKHVSEFGDVVQDIAGGAIAAASDMASDLAEKVQDKTDDKAEAKPEEPEAAEAASEPASEKNSASAE